MRDFRSETEIAMDITSALDANLRQTVGKAAAGLELKLNQIIEAKVIDNQLLLNALTLKVADKTLSLQTQQPLNLRPGQALQLQVLKLPPEPEFKILAQASGLVPTDNISQPLKLAPHLAGQATPAAAPAPTLPADKLVKGQQIVARVIEIINNKITLQLMPTVSANGDITPASPAYAGKALMTLDLKQLSPTPKAFGTQTPLNALADGEILHLQVIKSGKTPIFAVSFLPVDHAGKIAEIVKQLLPIQNSPLPLLNQLTQSLSGEDANVAETLKQLAREILSNLPRLSQLADAPGLKQAIDDSGLFLERKLLELLAGKPDIDLSRDFKLKLLQLAQFLGREPSPAEDNTPAADIKLLAEILQKTQGALAKLTLDQLNTLPREEGPKQGWTLEIPFFHDNKPGQVHIEIDRDQAGNREQASKNWVASITITPPNLGTIRCKISCYDGSVNTRFSCETASTVELINAHLAYLKQQFEDKGLSTGFMDAQQGLATLANGPKIPLTHLLSEKA